MTRNGSTGTRKIFSVFRYPRRGSIHPSTRQRRAVITTRGKARRGFRFSLKNYFDFGRDSRPEARARGGSFSCGTTANFIIAGANERAFSRSQCTLVSRLTRVIAVRPRKFYMVEQSIILAALVAYSGTVSSSCG